LVTLIKKKCIFNRTTIYVVLCKILLKKHLKVPRVHHIRCDCLFFVVVVVVIIDAQWCFVAYNTLVTGPILMYIIRILFTSYYKGIFSMTIFYIP